MQSTMRVKLIKIVTGRNTRKTSHGVQRCRPETTGSSAAAAATGRRQSPNQAYLSLVSGIAQLKLVQGYESLSK